MFNLIKLANNDFAITEVTPIYQYYSNGERISVKQRKNCGIVFLSDCCAKYSNASGKLFVAEKNSIVFLPEGSTYEVEFFNSSGMIEKSRISDRLVNFKISGCEITGDFPTVTKNHSVPTVSILFDDIFSLESAQNRLKLNTALYTLLNLLINKNTACCFALKPAMDFIAANPDFQSLNVNALAKACNMHITTFRRHFENEFGISPSKYIKNIFVNRANYHLITEQRSVKDVAYILGFKNISYFSRFYKENTGFLPSETKASR